MSEFDIPVLFQVTSETEDEAADALASFLGGAIDLPRRIGGGGPDPATTIESWHMPNHQFADGSDNPVRVIVVPLEPAYNDRQALVREIQRLVDIKENA